MAMARTPGECHCGSRGVEEGGCSDTQLWLPKAGKGDEGGESSMKPAPAMKDQAKGFWSMKALLLTTASVFKGRENGPQRLVILFSEEIDAGNREMLH